MVSNPPADPDNLQDVGKMMEKFENGMDAELFRRGVMRNASSNRCMSKVCLPRSLAPALGLF